MSPFQHPEIEFALQLVADACQITRAVHAALGAAHIEKSDLSPVSVADLTVQAIAGLRLMEQRPGAVLVGEETSDVLQGERGGQALVEVARFAAPFAPGATADNVAGWVDHGAGEPGASFWTLDPVDGTKGFLRGDQYAVALGLVEDGVVQLGLLGCPNLDPSGHPERGGGMIAVAARGKGAWARPLEGGAWTPLHVSQCPQRDARVLRSFEKAHTNASQTDLIMQAMGIEASAITMDSQAKYAVLASGHAEMLLRLLNPGKESYKERIWDQAAGSILLEEAGGRITDLRGERLDFSQGRSLARNTGVLATNGAMHDAALQAVQSVCGL
ncbi:MAG: Inositol-monophosphatase [Candidatus Hydrogenedentota bacterium]|jgi:3'(2'), 5'-bisphosphate nucleotidase